MSRFIRTAMKWGLILGFSLLLWPAAIHFVGVYTVHIEYAGMVDRAATVIPIAVLTLALLELRREQYSSPSFHRGVLTGVTVAAISAPITVAGLWYYHHYVTPDRLPTLIDFERRTFAAAGAPADVVATRIARLQQSGSDRQQVISGFIGTIVMGLVLSVAASAVLTFVDRVRQTRSPSGQAADVS